MPFIFVRSSANGEIYIDCNCDEWSEMAESIERILSPARQLQVDLPKSPGCLISTIRPHDEVLHKLAQVDFNVVASNTVGETTVSTLARRGPDPGVPNISNAIYVRNSMNMDEFQVNRVAKKAYFNKQTYIDCNGNGRLAREMPDMPELQTVAQNANQENLFSTPQPPYVVLDALEARGFRVVEAKTEVDGVTTVWTLRHPMA